MEEHCWREHYGWNTMEEHYGMEHYGMNTMEQRTPEGTLLMFSPTNILVQNQPPKICLYLHKLGVK